MLRLKLKYIMSIFLYKKLLEKGSEINISAELWIKVLGHLKSKIVANKVSITITAACPFKAVSKRATLKTAF